MNYAAVWVAWRRAMRRHQHVPEHGWQAPMWRLIGGELVWAARRLVARPWVLVGLLVGFAAALGVLGAAAPGPSLDAPWRVLVAIAAGLLVAAGIRGLRVSPESAGGDGAERSVERQLPLVGAWEISGGLTVAILIVWLGMWLVEHIT
jgi:hypothetical protein